MVEETFQELPSNEEAEKSLIGTIIINPGYITRVIGWIKDPSIFHFSKYRRLWLILEKMYKEGEPIDLVTVSDKLDSNDHSEGLSYELAECTESVVSAELIESYAKIVYRRYTQRKVATRASQLQEAASKGKDSEELLEKALRDIQELQMLQPSKRKEFDVIISDAEVSIKSKDNIIPFGVPAFDAPAGGMTRKEITALGGRPGHGKTTTTINIIKSLVEQHRKVLFFSREMSNAEIIKKLVVLESPLRYDKIRRGTLSKDEKVVLDNTLELIRDKYSSNLILYDDVWGLEEAVTEIRRNPGVDVIVEDYIQLIRTSGSKDRRFQLEDIMHEYKYIAKSQNCSVFLVSQLNREIEKRIIDPRPRMSDFAESGAIEQNAENALFVFYGYAFDSENFGENEFEIISAKTRYGKIGTYRVGYNGDRCKIYASEAEAQAGL